MSEKVFTIEEAQEHISWLINEIESIIPKRNSIKFWHEIDIGFQGRQPL